MIVVYGILFVWALGMGYMVLMWLMLEDEVSYQWACVSPPPDYDRIDQLVSWQSRMFPAWCWPRLQRLHESWNPAVYDSNKLTGGTV